MGGLCWLINNSGRGVHVDVVKKKKWTLGAKIAAGEVLVEVLRDMQCPWPVSSHQIQGNDMPAIYSVIQWLVKQVRSWCDGAW